MDGAILALGLFLGLLFCLFMVFVVLPPLDHIVKKNQGPVEACVCTRFCPLVIGLPFYVFTIWMTVVILFGGNKAISVIEQICSDDFDCTNSFALGRAQFDKDVCLSVDDCSFEELQARSGQKPLHFPRLGLGSEMEPSEFVIEYTCTDVVNGTCVSVTSSDGDCGCSGSITEDSVPLDCASDTCLGDIPENTRTTTCSNEDCSEWIVETDSKKQFSFQNCSCVDESCDVFSCEVFVMQYFYPNIFYAGSATILFILPVFLLLYWNLKTHMKKIIPCAESEMYVFSQEAGMQEEYTADKLVTGGFYVDQEQSQVARKFGWKDVVGMILGVLVLIFFGAQILLVSGRVGLSFISLVPVLVAIVEVYRLVKHIQKLQEGAKDREYENSPNPLRAEF